MRPNRKEQTGRSTASSKRRTYLQARQSRSSPYAGFPVPHNLEVLSPSSRQKHLRPTLLRTYNREKMGKGGSRTCGGLQPQAQGLPLWPVLDTRAMLSAHSEHEETAKATARHNKQQLEQRSALP